MYLIHLIGFQKTIILHEEYTTSYNDNDMFIKYFSIFEQNFVIIWSFIAIIVGLIHHEWNERSNCSQRRTQVEPGGGTCPPGFWKIIFFGDIFDNLSSLKNIFAIS
jgi:hypothetical protein